MPREHVVAVTRIVEENFDGQVVHVHAERWDLGEILGRDSDGLATVRWQRTGTATVCADDEFTPMNSDVIRRLVEEQTALKC